MPKVHNHIKVDFTVSDTALSLADIGYTAAQIAGAQGLVVTPSGNNIRYLGSGTPTTTSGHLAPQDVTSECDDGGCKDLKFIRDDTADVPTTFELDTFVEV